MAALLCYNIYSKFKDVYNLDINIITSRIIYLGIFVLLGFFGVILKYIKPSASEGISSILTKFCLPCLVITGFTSFDLDLERLKSGIYILIMAYTLIYILYLLGKCFAKILGLTGYTASAHAFLTACGNVSFMGYPIITAVLGAEGLYYAMFFTLANDMVVWTFGVVSLTKGSNRKNGNLLLNLLNPNTLSLVGGFILMVLGIKIPSVLFEPMEALGNCTVPLSMFFIGMTIASIKPAKFLGLWKSLFIVIVKMLLVPVLLIFVFSAIKKFEIIPEIALIASIMQVAVPSGTAYAIISKTYGGDYEYASQCVFLTTVLSFVTIPLVYYLIYNLGSF